MQYRYILVTCIVLALLFSGCVAPTAPATEAETSDLGQYVVFKIVDLDISPVKVTIPLMDGSDVDALVEIGLADQDHISYVDRETGKGFVQWPVNITIPQLEERGFTSTFVVTLVGPLLYNPENNHLIAFDAAYFPDTAPVSWKINNNNKWDLPAPFEELTAGEIYEAEFISIGPEDFEKYPLQDMLKAAWNAAQVPLSEDVQQRDWAQYNLDDKDKELVIYFPDTDQFVNADLEGSFKFKIVEFTNEQPGVNP